MLPQTGDTVSYIEAHIPALIPSERRVARAFAERPGEMALLSVAEVAERADTSPSTVIRTCQSLGFKGFQHLRLLLLRDAENRTALADRSDSSAAAWLPEYFRTVGSELQNSFGALDYGKFDEVVAAVVGANRVLVLGNGGSAPAAGVVALGLISLGKGCEAPADSVVQQLTAATLGVGDVCLALSSSGMNQVTLQAATAAAETKATVIGIAGYARSALQEVSTITLVAGTPSLRWGGVVGGNLAQILLANALVRAVEGALGTGMSARLLGRVASLLEPLPGTRLDAAQ
jgi:RpiR family carbohydrate utilization transcriptional regulator